jgi:hypothetical protein
MSAAGCEAGVAVAAGVCVPLPAVSVCFGDSVGFAVVGLAGLFVVGAGWGSAAVDSFEGAEVAGFGLSAAGATSVAAGGAGGGVPCAL